MKNNIDNINIVLKDDLKEFNRCYNDTLESPVKLINRVISYISKSKGKQLRPILLLLSANLCGKPNQKTYIGASLVELLHVATLIHDDIVDDANIRRGFPSVKRIWKNKISLLIGDYMFSKALQSMIKIRDFDALELLSETAKKLSEGEILQIEKAIKRNMTEELYFDMVKDKTASLFSASCMLGAITVTKDEDQRQALARFGEKLGVAFQIKDDLFDIVGKIGSVGKPVGFDIKKNMLTLPFIYTLSKLNKIEKRLFLLKLKKMTKQNKINDIKSMIDNYGSIEYTENVMKRISDEAKNDLVIFPESAFKKALCDILDYNLIRSK